MNSETPVTPKAALQWQIDPSNMVYFTYSKGFRSGGGNASIPYDLTYQDTNVGCTQDFINMGIPHAPDSYKSDTVQSFEVGAKNNIENRIRLASSIYYIKWNNIQGNVVPPICQIQWTDNLGNAVLERIRHTGGHRGDQGPDRECHLRLYRCALHEGLVSKRRNAQPGCAAAGAQR